MSYAFNKSLLHPRNWGTWFGLGVLWLIVQLPYPVLHLIGTSAGRASRRFLKRREHIARRNLELCFPTMSPAAREKLIEQNFMSLGMGLIETGMARGQDAAQFAGRIRLEAGRLQFLIDDIMRLSEIEDGGKGEWEQVPLLKTARQAADTLALEAAEKEVSIFCQGEELEIEANGRMMEELTVNLLSNGVKYNRPGGFACHGAPGRNGRRHRGGYRHRHPPPASGPGF